MAINAAIIKNILGYEIPNTCPVMYLSNFTNVVKNEDLYSTRILIAASKKTVTRHRLSINIPNQEQWLEMVHDISVLEKLTYFLKVKEGMFEKKWKKWHVYKGNVTN